MKSDHEQPLFAQMERIGDIPVTVRAELDRTTLSLAELMDLEVGSVVPLSRPTGENIDIYIEEELLGWGEVLLMDGTMTVRLSDLRNARQSDLLEEEGVELAETRGT